ncbi:MAG TPA: hypothetical protein VFP55_00340 [Solirubrobacteraceae bacterium]|nr:hypothetical protein [Solirubrobacteraceae bacterium]
MLVFEAIVAAALIVLVVGALFFVMLVHRSHRPPRFNPIIWGCSIAGLGLAGIAIAWTTSALS